MNAADLITRFHDALNRRDLEAALALTHPHARFPDYLEGGEVVGHDAIRTYLQRLFDTLSPGLDLITTEIAPDGRVRADIQSSIRHTSGRLWSDTRVTVLYEIADGLVLRADFQDGRG